MFDRDLAVAENYCGQRVQSELKVKQGTRNQKYADISHQRKWA
jgi:hypothetical protein